MKITERRLVTQHWYETEYSRTGWDNHKWTFDDGATIDVYSSDWIIVEHLQKDKFGNPILGIAEKETEIKD